MTALDDQLAKAAAFRSLHDEGIFVMPCAWDPGSAAILQAAGFSALATTSGGVNWRLGRRDYVYAVPRESMMREYGEIAASTSLPLSGDLENGYGDGVADVVETIRLAIEHGMVGGSIEDQETAGGYNLLPVDLAAERIAAARSCADSLLANFTLTARAESLYGSGDNLLSDAIDRANRYVEAGADCIFVPGVASIEEIKRLVHSVPAAISVGIGSGGAEHNLDALAAAGVRRISTGGALPRALYARLAEVSAEMMQQGTFTFLNEAISDVDLEAHFPAVN